MRRVPEWHPEHATFKPFPVHVWVVHHPDGVVVVDSGIGPGHPIIDEMYAPECASLVDALGGVNVDERDVVALVLSHLHFDHCGQHSQLAAPAFVQHAELEAAQQPGYTVAEWAAIPSARLRAVSGDTELVSGIRLIATPGHTPGHQSVVIEGGGERVVLAAQCAFGCDEVRTGRANPQNLHDLEWEAAATESLARVRALRPVVVELSHDPERIDLA